MHALRQRNQSQLQLALVSRDIPEPLSQAMQYALLEGGKRVRALLVYGAGIALNASIERLDSVASAIETMHCYSLIHDDLPAMDDDELRRGRATVHIEFDEATAILAGDALNTLAFELLTDPATSLNDWQARTITQLLASNAGAQGMVGGQMLDIEATQQQLSQPDLENVHRRKTGALIKTAILAGAICGIESASDESMRQLPILEKFAENLGLAFQVVDDILDVEATTEQLGKPSGSDQALGKSTYPALLGLEESKQLAENLYQAAIASLGAIGDNTQLLEQLATLIVRRDH